MKELDVVMTGYLERYYRDASNQEQGQFRALLAMPDPELYDLLLGRSRSYNSGSDMASNALN